MLSQTVLWVALLSLDPAPVDRAADERPPEGATSGEKYVGVRPGAKGRNPLPVPRRDPAHLIWSGFQMNEQGSRVFFQLSREVTYDLSGGEPGNGKPAVLSVFLRNCRIHLANNRRNMDTRFFATPIEGVSARQRRKDVELRIVLREPASPTPKLEEGPDGTHFLVLDFPPAKASPPADTADDEGTTTAAVR